MKTIIAIFCSVVALVSCQRQKNPLPKHLIGFEINGQTVEDWQFQESGKTPYKIFCYYIDNGKIIKDGQEIIFVNKNEIITNQYRYGVKVDSQMGTSIHN